MSNLAEARETQRREARRTILFVSHSAEMYGAERSLLELVTALDSEEFNPVVLVPARGPLAEELEAASIEVVAIKYHNWIGGRHLVPAAAYRTAANAAACYRLWCAFRERSIDLIYTNTSATPVGGLLAAMLGAAHLWHVRELVMEGSNAVFYYGPSLSYWFVERTSDQVVCNSHALKKALSQYIAPQKMTVVQNGVVSGEPSSHACRMCHERRTSVKLAMVGGLGRNKGHEDAIRALRVLEQLGIEAELRVAGSGSVSYQQVLRGLARELGVADRFTLLGYVDDPSELYQTSDIVLICSRWEAFGRVAVEAQATGCPVVATDRGGVAEIVLNGETGLLYEPGNYLQLAQRIRSLCKDPELYTRISRASIESVYPQFLRSRYVAEMRAVIEEVAGSPRVATA